MAGKSSCDEKSALEKLEALSKHQLSDYLVSKFGVDVAQAFEGEYNQVFYQKSKIEICTLPRPPIIAHSL